MTIKGNYKMLFELRQDLTNQAKSSIAFRLLHKKQIAFFFEYNKVALARADELDQALVKKYVVHNNKGEPQHDSINGGRVLYRFTDEAAKANFTREYHHMLETACVVGI